MLDMGFIEDVKWIAKGTPSHRQTLLFSATVDDRLNKVINQLLKNPLRIDLSEKMAPELIKQEVYLADNLQHKVKLLQYFLKEINIFKGIIFSATKINADKLAKQLRDEGYLVQALHGDLKQSMRNRTIEEFRRGRVQFLIATDVAARGLDISDVSHVINYDLPKFSEDYVHRIGRTGRAGKSGMAISLALPVDARHLQKIERFVGQRIPLLTIEGLEPKNGFAANPAKKKSHKKKSGKRPERRFEQRSERRPEHRTEKRSEQRAEKRPEYRSEKRSEPRSEKRPEFRSEKRSEYRSEKRPEFRSEKRSEHRSEKRPEFRSEKRSEHRSEKRPEFRSEKRAEHRSEKRPEFRSEKRSEQRSERRPEYRSEKRTEKRSEKPGSFPKNQDKPFKKYVKKRDKTVN
jgi:superfamily II DNA/RNA helicase